MSRIESHIVLIGFMGSGKSTVGKVLAKKLNMAFVDMDEYIEKQEGEKIKSIFSSQGEPYFRKLESEVLDKLLSMPEKMIISTGGGAPCFYDNMDQIKSSSVSFYLRVGVGRLMNRLSQDTTRPLLQHRTKNELKLFIKRSIADRSKFYQKADYTLRGADAPKHLADRIKEKLTKLK